ncbi:MAG TPA: glutathione transferase GstA [Dyella sp.]|uniref:glutathione transferase GstA n=1 Tax=Dyella sp. TaxID=1869338 RepID=UPI002D78A2B6|nr:glutathione transferase GstA [Dyella sp.]HET6555540.1 glutathione transferase GstA [Dyella sp.]
MKLYYATGACSLSPHIVALEAGIALELEKVDTKEKRTASGADYWQINPKGYVPALALDNGELLTEGPAIVQYLADQKPDSKLAPANGTAERYRLQEMLGYINSELHKSYTPLFKPDTTDAVKQERKEYLRKRYALIEQRLAKHDWLVGDHFSVADAYLFTVTNWAKHVDLDLSDFPALLAFQKRAGARPKVQEAMVAEGLIKSAA